MSDLDLHRPQFMPDLLVAALDANGDRDCLVLGDKTWSAHEVRDQISRMLQALRQLGIKPHTQGAMLSKNRPELLMSVGANMLLPLRNTALHPLGSLDDHAFVIADAGVEVLVFDPAYAERAAQLQQREPQLKHLLSLGPAEVGTDIVELAAGLSPEPLVAPQVDVDSRSGIGYTGGTTGRPKGVMSTFRSTATMAHLMTTEWQWPQEVRHLVCTPLSHAGGAFFVPVLLHGGSLVVIPQFEAGAVLDAVEKYRITTMMLVPSMIYALLDHPRFADADLSSLETIFYGASAVSPTRMQEAIRKLGPIFFQFYGQTEAPQSVCVMRKEEHLVDDLARLSAVGRPVPWLRVALLDDDGNRVSDGEPGELCVQGPLVMKGYLNRPEETAEALANGWLHTGDVARAGRDGFLTIVDRKKDMIVSGGFNIYPREVEDAIGTDPAVAAVAVVGVPDDKWGEAVKALIVPQAGEHVDLERLADTVRRMKGAHHVPKSFDIVASIPLTPVGKPDKKAIRAKYWTGTDRLVH